MPTIRELPASLQPMNRLAQTGPIYLSDSELLSIVLGNANPRNGHNTLDLATQMLTQFDGLHGLARATQEELRSLRAIGPSRAAQIQASLELGRRMATSRAPERASIRSPQDVANLLMSQMMQLEKEELRVLLLNTKNHLIGVSTIYQGSLNTSVVRVGEVFTPAVRANAASIIVVHNHPSSDPSPSPEDVATTQMLVDAGRLLDIPVIDHVVFGHNRYVSMKERNLGFSCSTTKWN